MIVEASWSSEQSAASTIGTGVAAVGTAVGNAGGVGFADVAVVCVSMVGVTSGNSSASPPQAITSKSAAGSGRNRITLMFMLSEYLVLQLNE